MKNVFGNSVTVTLAGESHGEAITVIIDGLKPGVEIHEDYIASRLALRRPAGTISTPRREADEFRILSGVFEGKTTGTPLCILIPNTAKKSADYDAARYTVRPGHADYTASVKYGGCQDFRGGGHFSGRITAGLVAAGAVAEQILAPFGIKIGTHVSRIRSVSDRDFADLEADITYLSDKNFPVLDEAKAEAMKQAIDEARMALDSIGGVLETAVLGVPAGLGEPWFDSVESRLSHILFSVPAVKGVEFGDGFGFASLRGSEANDPFRYADGVVITETNRNGGINGGITNGMPLLFRCAVKPTPSIGKEQNTVDLREGKETTLSVGGRHDPCIVHRAASVVNACTALVLLDLMAERYGTNLEF